MCAYYKEMKFRFLTMWTIPRVFIDRESFDEDLYVILWGPYMYTGNTAGALFLDVVTAFWHPRNLVG